MGFILFRDKLGAGKVGLGVQHNTFIDRQHDKAKSSDYDKLALLG